MSTSPLPKRRDLSLRRGWKVFATIQALAWDVARGRLLVSMTLNVLVVIATSLQGLFTGFLVNALIHRQFEVATHWVLVMVALYVVNLTQGAIATFIRNDLSDRITHSLELRIMEATTRPAGLDHLERAEFANKVEMVRDSSWLVADAIENVNSLMFIGLGVFTSGALLVSIHPVLLLVVLVSAPVMYFEYWAARRFFETFGETSAPEQRTSWHLFWIATRTEAAKEIRLFNLADHLVKRHEEVSLRYLNRQLRARARWSTVSMLSGAAYGLILAGSIAWVATQVVAGRLSLGALATAVIVTQQVVSRAQQAGQALNWAAEVMFVGQRLLWLLDYRDPLAVANPVPVPRPVRRGITFEHVSFGYPGADHPVLRDVSFHLPAGSTVAVVGENGAGKTSIVKLLCRFYDPDEGRVLVDGVDLRSVDPLEWRAGFSAAFQDFHKFQFRALHSIGVGDVPFVEDRDRVLAAVDRSGTTALLETMPEGLDTQLGTWFQGQELSEGQWQRIALARGAMRRDPSVLVLDEPTAALDARAEHEVFGLFQRMSRPESGELPITLLVSHRFSTVRMADMIIVMDQGRVIETGSHEELMRAGGRYAELFSLQASHYD